MRYQFGIGALGVFVLALMMGASPALSGEGIRIGGTGASLGYTRVMGEAYMSRDPGTRVVVREGLGSSGSIRAVISGVLDIAISGRPLKEKEAVKGVIAEELLVTPFGFYTSRPEPVDIAATDVPQLYAHAGYACDWFGGEVMRIVLRPHSDSDLELAGRYFDGLSETMETARTQEGIPIAQTDQDNADIAEAMSNSLTTGTLLQMVSENRELWPLRIDGVAPSLEAMESGAYRYTKTLYLVHRGTPDDSVRAFATYLLSDEAVAITE
jgi:phosphate transport system substrate-binding protein